jgi:hypothetical protein
MRTPRIAERLLAVIITAAAAGAAIAGWLAASWQSVGTPLYPLIPGNANTFIPSERDPTISTIGDYAANALDHVRSGSLFWVVLAVIVVAIIARRLLPDATLVVIICFTASVTMVAITAVLSVASDRDFGRYAAPVAESVAVFLFYETLRAFERSSSRAEEPSTDRRGAILVGSAVLGLLLVFTPIAVQPDERTPLLPSGFSSLRWGQLPLLGFERADEGTPLGLRRQWDRALKLVDPDHTIVAVDRPYLIDYTRFDFPSMDLPGWAAPNGTFPIFQGPDAKLAALQDQGFTHLIVTDPERERCLLPSFLQYERRWFDPPDSEYARYFLDWVNDITFTKLKIPSASTRVGHLWIIDIDEARRVYGGAPAEQ